MNITNTHKGGTTIKKNKQKTQLKRYIPLIFFIILGIVCGFLAGLHSLFNIFENKTRTEILFWFVFFFLGIYVALFLQILIHEVGHLVFGLLTGYKFSSLRIGSCMLVKENGHLKIKWLSISGTAGQCLLVPPESFDENAPFFLYNLGGSILNSVSSFVFFMLYLRFENAMYFSTFLLSLIVIGVAFALLNGIPIKQLGNDGYNISLFAKDRETLRYFLIQLRIMEKVSRGIRLKDMPAEWFSILRIEEMKNSVLASMGVLDYNRLLDKYKIDEASQFMEQLLSLDSLAGVHRNLLVCDRIYYEIIGENRKDVLDTMLDDTQKQFMKEMKKFPTVIRTKYAYELMVENDLEKAKKTMLEFEKIARTHPYSCDIESERELINIVNQASDGISAG